MPTLRALRKPLLELLAIGLVFALLGFVTGIGSDPNKLFWDAIISFCIHVFVVIAIAAPVLGGILIYRRIRLRRLLARIGRDIP